MSIFTILKQTTLLTIKRQRAMKATKYTNSKGLSKGAFIYSIKKNGERYAQPTFYTFIGLENSEEDILKRLETYNPNCKFEIA